MSRNGKIARLPRKIRDELNRRLDDAEQGARLVEWLNSLPEVKQILDTDFEGRAINEVNLTEWKQGGFLDWQVQQETMAGLVNVKADGQELAGAGGSVTDDLEAIVMARYATTLYSSNGEMSAEVQARLQSLSKSLRDLVRYRRCQQSRDRTQILRESLEIKRQKTEEGQRKKFLELAKDRKIHERLTPKMTEEERTEAIKRILFPNGL